MNYQMQVMRFLSAVLSALVTIGVMLLIMLSSGCWKAVPSKTPSAVVSPIGDATTTASGKVKDVDKAENERKAMAAANVTNIQVANAGAVPGPIKETIKDEAKLALLNLSTTPDPKELVAGEQRLRFRAEGKADAAERSSAESVARANTASAAAARALAERDLALARVGEAVAKAESDIAANNAAHAAAMLTQNAQHKTEIDELKKKIEAKELGFLTCIAGGIGGLCLLAAIGVAVASFYSPLGFNFKNVCVSGLLVASAVCCFGIVRFINHSWIPHATGGVIIVCFLVALVLWFLNWRDHRKEAVQVETDTIETETKLQALTATAATIVDQVEIFAKEMPEEAKGLLARINAATSDEQDKLIRTLKTIRPSKK